MNATAVRKGRAIEQALTDFVRVFNDLDWDGFAACFAEDATVFAPFPDQPRMAVGKAALEKGWRPVFERVRANHPGPPYLNIDPKDTHVRPLGENACVVTFHLEGLIGATRLRRRTAVFGKRDDRWLIVHLHASVASETM